jgi:ribosomal protein L37AE/L43A
MGREEHRMAEDCKHRNITSRPGTWPAPEWCCSDCGEALPYPGGCSHLRIDNETWQCQQCGERMVNSSRETETIRSAPNAAPCRDPQHLAAIAAGEDFQCDHPYVPDLSREQIIPIWVHLTYECERCRYDGTVFSAGDQPIWDCGHSHRGDSISLRGAAAGGFRLGQPQ